MLRDGGVRFLVILVTALLGCAAPPVERCERVQRTTFSRTLAPFVVDLVVVIDPTLAHPERASANVRALVRTLVTGDGDADGRPEIVPASLDVLRVTAVSAGVARGVEGCADPAGLASSIEERDRFELDLATGRIDDATFDAIAGLVDAAAASECPVNAPITAAAAVLERFDPTYS